MVSITESDEEEEEICDQEFDFEPKSQLEERLQKEDEELHRRNYMSRTEELFEEGPESSTELIEEFEEPEQAEEDADEKE